MTPHLRRTCEFDPLSSATQLNSGQHLKNVEMKIEKFWKHSPYLSSPSECFDFNFGSFHRMPWNIRSGQTDLPINNPPFRSRAVHVQQPHCYQLPVYVVVATCWSRNHKFSTTQRENNVVDLSRNAHAYGRGYHERLPLCLATNVDLHIDSLLQYHRTWFIMYVYRHWWA